VPAYYAYTVGMKRRHSAQYTIRSVPAEVDRRLRDSARRLHRSLNRTLVDILARAAGASEPAVYRDLDAFFGSWVADAEVDQALAEQRRIDRKLWR
jgi:Antitoxin FitA-like, ribbon-helix-helix